MDMTKVITTLAEGNTQDCAHQILAALTDQAPGRHPALLMVFASPSQPLAELLPVLSAAFPQTSVLGASSAGEFTEKGDIQGGVSAFALFGDFEVRAGLGSGLKANVQGSVEQAIQSIPESLDGYAHQTALILLDTLSGVGEEAALLTSALLGDEVRLVGGAAGDKGMVRTVVGVGPKVESDAIVVAKLFSKEKLGLGVYNGHKPLSPKTFNVTRSEGNVVYELDGRPAWDIWVEQTRAHALSARGVDPATLQDPTEVFLYMVVYEAGLQLGGHEYKMRSPIAKLDNGAMSFACGIPEGSVIQMMESDPARQVASANEAARRAVAQLQGRPIAGALVFDCIRRKSILGDHFRDAIASMYAALHQAPLAGFETYGEIALDTGEMSGFHNTTTVVLAFPA